MPHKSKDIFIADNVSLASLNNDTNLCKKDSDYIMCREKMQELKVVNDIVERIVSLIQSFNLILIKKESQKQYLLQIVENTQKITPS